LSQPFQPPLAPQKLPLKQPWALFGGISPEAFMKRYWHKKPLLVRGAIPAFQLHAQNDEVLDSPISYPELVQLAGKETVESRLIQSKPWRFAQGPFNKQSIPKIQQPDWTLLLQGMEAHHPAAANILSWFRFIPDARLDDLMISIAGIGGGVGPHFDSYDVFLIQMSGRRRWRISQQTDLSLRSDLPLKILKKFACEEEWVLEPGDMLYLPPHVAHDGIALDAGCQTWSVGFRSPSFKELLQEGLWRLAESLEDFSELDKKFADPKQNATQHPQQIPDELILQIQNQLNRLQLNRVDQFLPGIATYLSEPKQQALFIGPVNALSANAFGQKLAKATLIPNPQTRILQLGESVFCNGEEVTKGQSEAMKTAWQTLAATKQLNVKKLKNIDKSSLYEAYLAGWLYFSP
jgi:50S ribosomal protein L16 3-hydroxylase